MFHFLNDVSFGLSRLDASGVIRWANKSAYEPLGYTREEYIGHPIAEFHADKAVGAELLARSVHERLHDFEARLKCKDGSIRTVLVDSSPSGDGPKRGIHCFTRDITDRKQVNESLLLISRLPAENPAPVIRVTRENILHFANPKAQEFLEEWKAKLGERAPAPILELIGEGGRKTAEIKLRDRWYTLAIVPVLNGEFINLYFSDITERKRAEESLRASELSLQMELADSRLLQSLSAAIVLEQNVEALYEQLTEAAQAIMRSDFASMQMLYPERGRGGELRLLAHRGLSPGAAAFWEWVQVDSASACAKAMQTGQRCVVPDVEECEFMAGSEDLAAFRETKIRAAQTTPLFSRSGKLVGMISTHWRHPHRPDERELRLLDILARQAADLIERKRAEARERALQESTLTATAKFEALFNQSGIFAGIMDLEGNLREINDLAVDWCGYTRSEVLGRPFWSTPWWRGSEESKARIRAATKQAAGGAVFRETLRYWVADGTERVVDFAMHPIRDESGRVRFLHPTGLDVTEQKRAERTLSQRTRLLEVINRIGATLAAELDLEKLVEAATDAGREVCGAQFGAFFYNVKNEKGESYTLYTLSGVPREAFSKLPMPRNTALFNPTFQGLGVIRLDDVRQDARFGKNSPYFGMPEGHLPVCSYLAVPVISRSGEVLGGLFYGHSEVGVFTEEAEQIIVAIAAQAAIAIDNAQLYRAAQMEITERKRVEAALRETEERFRAVIDNSTALIYVKDCEGRYRLINERYTKVFRTAPETFTGKTDFDLFPPEVARKLRENDLTVQRTGEAVEVEEVAPHEDGPHTYLSVKFPLRRSDGSIYGVAGISTDISERKRSESVDRLLGAIVESSDDAIVSKNLQGIIQSWNKGAELMFGYRPDEVIGRPITILIPEERMAEEPSIIERIGRGERIEHYETVRRRKDGSLLDVSLSVSPIRNKDGVVVGASKIARDITERKRADERLELAVLERTASLREAIAQMEEFSYTVSHDLRAPLRAMQGYADALLQDFSSALPEQARHFLMRIAANSTRLDKMILDVLTFSRVARAELRLERVALDKLVRRVVEQYPGLQAPEVEIEIKPLHDVLGHEPSLTQIISNLLNNAVKFVPPNTKPKVSVWSETLDGQVRVWVADNGIGIDPKYHHRLFSMFERIHPELKYAGTGVGLAIVRKAVERMGGKFGLESAVSQGSRFWFELRAVDRPASDTRE